MSIPVHTCECGRLTLSKTKVCDRCRTPDLTQKRNDLQEQCEIRAALDNLFERDDRAK